MRVLKAPPEDTHSHHSYLLVCHCKQDSVHLELEIFQQVEMAEIKWSTRTRLTRNTQHVPLRPLIGQVVFQLASLVSLTKQAF